MKDTQIHRNLFFLEILISFQFHQHFLIEFCSEVIFTSNAYCLIVFYNTFCAMVRGKIFDKWVYLCECLLYQKVNEHHDDNSDGDTKVTKCTPYLKERLH